MELSENGKFTDESEGAAIKIQAVFRGHRSRQGLAKQSSEDETKSMVVIVITIRLSQKALISIHSFISLDVRSVSVSTCFEDNLMTRSFRGVADLWSDINHIAIVVKDVGTSVTFYTQVIGMTQIMRPDFDR